MQAEDKDMIEFIKDLKALLKKYLALSCKREEIAKILLLYADVIWKEKR